MLDGNAVKEQSFRHLTQSQFQSSPFRVYQSLHFVHLYLVTQAIHMLFCVLYEFILSHSAFSTGVSLSNHWSDKICVVHHE